MLFDLAHSWALEVSGGLSRNEVDGLSISPSLFGGAGNVYWVSEHKLRTADVKASGPLASLPAGAVKLAVGLGHRSETYEFASGFQGGDPFVSAPKERTRVNAAFAEIQLPLLGAKINSTAGPRLLLTMAGRFEDYSTFGNTFNPKLGLRWTPTDSLALRTTYGTSFKSPNIYQLNDFNGFYSLLERPDVQSSTGFTRALSLGGNNPELHEERAETWTVGIDLTPKRLPGFRADLTYFSVDYTDRIQEVSVPTNTILNDPVYATMVTRRGQIPDEEFDALLRHYLSGRILTFGCAVPLDPTTGACNEDVSNIGVLIDRRLKNLAGMEVSGLDITLMQHFDNAAGSFTASLNSSYLFEYSHQITAGSAIIDYLNTGHNPVDLRLRAGLTWNKEAWSVSTFLNYTDDYRDVISEPSVGVDSWTTMDINVNYDADAVSGHAWSSGISVALNISNALDSDPPFLGDNFYGTGYDPSNADPLGRVISLSLTKRW